jgi:hypothetical protein
MLKSKDKKRVLKAAGEKLLTIYKGSPERSVANLLLKTHGSQTAVG